MKSICIIRCAKNGKNSRKDRRCSVGHDVLGFFNGGHQLGNDGSGDIGYAYSITVDVEYDEYGWPTQSTAAAIQPPRQHNDGSSVITYEYVEL